MACLAALLVLIPLHTGGPGNHRTSRLPYLYGYLMLVENGMLLSATKLMPPEASVDSTTFINPTSYNPLRPSPTLVNGVMAITATGNRYTGRGSAQANNNASIEALCGNIGLLSSKDRPAVRVRIHISPAKPTPNETMASLARDVDAAQSMGAMARNMQYRTIVRSCMQTGLDPYQELPDEVLNAARDLLRAHDVLAITPVPVYHTPPATNVQVIGEGSGSNAQLIDEGSGSNSDTHNDWG